MSLRKLKLFFILYVNSRVGWVGVWGGTDVVILIIVVILSSKLLC